MAGTGTTVLHMEHAPMWCWTPM